VLLITLPFRYHEMLFMIDTCQANTMYSKFYSPNIIATGSSEIDQSSYSHHADQDVGVAVIDRYTYYNLEFLETQIHDQSSKLNLGDLFDSYDESKIHSHPGVRYDLFPGGEKALLTVRDRDRQRPGQGADVYGDLGEDKSSSPSDRTVFDDERSASLANSYVSHVTLNSSWSTLDGHGKSTMTAKKAPPPPPPSRSTKQPPPPPPMKRSALSTSSVPYAA